MQWTQDGSRLSSGTGNNLDRGIARQFTIPAGNPTATVNLEYQTEQAWDFAFVQVYDEAAKKWVSLANANTTTVSDPDANANIKANLPGFTGNSGGVTAQTFDLSAYAGKTVWLAVRYMTDGSVAEPGVWLSGLSVGGTAVGDATQLSTWKSLTGAVPVSVEAGPFSWSAGTTPRSRRSRSRSVRATPSPGTSPTRSASSRRSPASS